MPHEQTGNNLAVDELIPVETHVSLPNVEAIRLAVKQLRCPRQINWVTGCVYFARLRPSEDYAGWVYLEMFESGDVSSRCVHEGSFETPADALASIPVRLTPFVLVTLEGLCFRDSSLS